MNKDKTMDNDTQTNMNIVIATIKSWNVRNFHLLEKKMKGHSFTLIDSKEKLTSEHLQKINPRYIFFPHWSWIIPKDIYENFECIVFHMTDLPFGRGGSPLQNLIERRIYDTKISAIRVVKELDAGDIYCKEPFSLKEGNADQILSSASDIIFTKMIPSILEKNPQPKRQDGQVVAFKRRTPEQSDIAPLKDADSLYDHIRMLDGEGYPPAFIETDDFHIEFTVAKRQNGTITAQCTFKKRDRS